MAIIHFPTCVFYELKRIVGSGHNFKTISAHLYTYWLE